MTATPSPKPRADSPLQGIKVLEATQYIAGPFAGQQLADFGADVIKIERPGSGDPFRTYTGGRATPNFGHNYRAYNRNKKSVVLDLQNPQAADVFRRLAAEADVVLENFRPGVMDRLGIGYDALSKINPRLIYCSVSGFSSDGPYRDRPAFDTVGQALSGMLHTFIDPKTPMLRGPTLVDQATAMQAALAIMGALYGRQATGVGARLEVTMIDASVGFIPDLHVRFTDDGLGTDPDTRAAVSQAFAMPCSDGVIAFQLGGLEKSWFALCKAMERPDIAKDPRFSERTVRATNWLQLNDTLRPVFLQHTRSHWERVLAEGDIPSAPVLSVPEVHDDTEVKHSGIFEQYKHPVAGPMVLMRRVARINRSRGAQQAPPALLGEHTDSVLRSVGYGDAELAALQASGVIGQTAAE